MKKSCDIDLEGLFKNLNNDVAINIREIPLGIEELTEYHIEHLFCDLQSFISCLNPIKEIPEVSEVRLCQNEMIVKLSDADKDDITIELNIYRISISLYGIYRPTPIETVEKIMNIFKAQINALIDQNKGLFIQ